jgi:cell division transport system permease protein
MQLVGATAGFIRKPFLIQSIYQGVLSSMIGLTLLMTLFFAINNTLESIEVSYTWQSFLLLVGSVTGLGVLISFISTWFALNKYLRMKLDDLY